MSYGLVRWSRRLIGVIPGYQINWMPYIGVTSIRYSATATRSTFGRAACPPVRCGSRKARRIGAQRPEINIVSTRNLSANFMGSIAAASDTETVGAMV